MAKRKEVADRGIIELIRSLALLHTRVEMTRGAAEFVVANGLTVEAVCAGVCEYIGGGGPVDETKTDAVSGRLGEVMYELHPTIDAVDYYVKVRLTGAAARRRLLLISVHF